MYTDIENRVNEIKKSLHIELQKMNAIDMDDRIMNIDLFENVVKSKISELKKLENLVIDINGNATSRYGTNIWMNAISEMQNMLKYKSLNPQMDKLSKLVDKPDEIRQKKNLIWNKIRIFLSKTNVER